MGEVVIRLRCPHGPPQLIWRNFSLCRSGSPIGCWSWLGYCLLLRGAEVVVLLLSHVCLWHSSEHICVIARQGQGWLPLLSGPFCFCSSRSQRGTPGGCRTWGVAPGRGAWLQDVGRGERGVVSLRFPIRGSPGECPD